VFRFQIRVDNDDISLVKFGLHAIPSHPEGKDSFCVKHLGLWEIDPPYFWRVKARQPPKATGKTQEYHLDDSTSQLPTSDKWLYVDPEYPEVYTP
jgi:hypothetical protein